MQRFFHLFQSDAKLHHFMEGHRLYKSNSLLIKILSSDGDADKALSIARQVKDYFTNSIIVGASSSEAVLFNGEQLTESVVVLFELYECLEVKSRIFSTEDVSPEQLARDIYGYYCDELAGDESPVNILFTEYMGVYRFVNKFNTISPIIRLAGGCVGNHYDENGGNGFIFDETGFHKNSVITFAVVGGNGYHYMDVSTSQDVITPSYNITKANGGVIEEIEGVPALKWMYNFLSISKDEENDYSNWQEIASQDYLVHFPLLLDNDGSGRFTRIDKDSGELCLYTTELFDNTPFRVGYVNPAKVVKDTHKICSDILDTPTEAMFSYICYFRKLFLENCAKWEIAPFSKHNICGIFLMGEIGFKDGKNSFYNGANIFTSIAENERYILPDYIALEGANNLKSDDTFLNKAYSKQRENISGNALLSTLKQKEKLGTENLHIDVNLNVPNIYQFEKDTSEKHYSKICIVESQTADATIAFAGQDRYYESVRDFINMFNNAVNLIPAEIKFNIYALNYKTLLIAAETELDDDSFVQLVKNMYEDFGFATSEKTSITAVNRVIILLDREDPIETGMNYLLSLKDSQETFIVCDSDYPVEHSINRIDDLKGIELLKRAVDKNLIVPYYQGIYDNEKKCIEKYEALIRIVDIDGTVYPPYSFLTLAKKYKFYNSISMMMIEKVLNDFENRKESVSINISKFDIVSHTFRDWILEKIKNFPEPERIVVEFLETEDITHVDVLLTFITHLKHLGTGIAIDDFGSGYSTFTNIVVLKPDYIKIDGSIIKDLLKNEDHQVILDSICYLSKRIGADTVAEFVENDEIQEFIAKSGITYSQGYLFSKPQELRFLPQE